MTILRAFINSLGVVPSAAGSVTGTAQVVLTDGTYASPAQLVSAGGGSGTSYATAFTTALSGTSGATNSPVTLTVTPGSGGWPNVAVTPTLTGVAGNVSATQTPTAGSTGALTFTITPTAAGTASIGATASGMANSSGARSYTVSAASSGSAYVVKNNSVDPFVSAASGASPVAVTAPLLIVRDAAGNPVNGLAQFPVALSTSSTTAPVSGTGDYSTQPNDTQMFGAFNQGTYPGYYGKGQTLYAWAHGRTGTVVFYVWIQFADGWTKMLNPDGSLFTINVAFQ